MDSRYSSILSLVVHELSTPKTHILHSLVALDLKLSNNLLTAGAEIAKENYEKLKETRYFKDASGIKHGLPTPHKLDCHVNKHAKKLKKTLKQNKAQTNFENMAATTTSKNTDCTNVKINQTLPEEEFNVHDSVVIKEEVHPNFENLDGSALLEIQKCEEMFDHDELLLLNEEDFKATFRVSHSSFKSLLLLLSNEEMEPIEDIPLYKKLLIVLWMLGHNQSYKDASQFFSVTEESVSSCFYDVCATLYDKCDSIIHWPTSEQCVESANRIEKEFGFPGVIGVLGCHYFSMSIPKEPLSRREHFNGKLRTYCLALQVVCDDKFIIRDIFPGLPGGRAESQVFKDSPLCEQLTSKTLVEPNKHILARSNYPQLPSMLTPYTKAVEELTEDEVDFNELHENVCQVVDQTFYLLLERFVSLKRLDPEVATMVLVTVCVIHNICMENNDFISAY